MKRAKNWSRVLIVFAWVWLEKVQGFWFEMAQKAEGFSDHETAQVGQRIEQILVLQATFPHVC